MYICKCNTNFSLVKIVSFYRKVKITIIYLFYISSSIHTLVVCGGEMFLPNLTNSKEPEPQGREQSCRNPGMLDPSSPDRGPIYRLFPINVLIVFKESVLP